MVPEPEPEPLLPFDTDTDCDDSNDANDGTQDLRRTGYQMG